MSPVAARRPGFNADTLYDWRGREREQTDCYGGSCGRTEWRRSSGEEQSIAGTIKPDSAGYGNSSGDADFFRHRQRSCVLAVSAASSKPSRPWPLFAICQVIGISKQGYCRSSGDRKGAGEATCSWNGSTTSACRKTKRMAATTASDGSFLGSSSTVAMLTETAGSTASAGNTA